MRVMTFDPKKNKQVCAGELVAGVFTRKVRPYHYMYTLKAYGMSADVIETLHYAGCKEVILITEKETLKSSFSDWETRSVSKNYGHGAQKFLSVDKMVVTYNEKTR
jgi:hypothetical protein